MAAVPVPRDSGAGRPPLAVRIAAVFVGVTAIWMLLGAGVGAILGEEYSRPAHIVRAVGATVLTVPAIFAARRLLDRAPFSGLQLTSVRAGWRPFALGVLCWAVPAAVAGSVVVALGWADLTVAASPGRLVAGVAVLTVLVFLYEALPEELIFRGYFFANVAERWSSTVAVPAQATLFTLWGLAIGAAESVDRVVLFFTFACALGVLRAVTGNLWSNIGFHWAFQITAQFLGPSWDAITLDDPDLAFGVAISLVPFAVTLIVAGVIARRRRSHAARLSRVGHGVPQSS
ncbi:caax amino protease [Mycolicibacterium smegmatis]|nr:caax amino protease [Mycolicibacterium smegmatis]